MATQSGKSNDRPKLRKVMSDFRAQTLDQIMHGFDVQHLPLKPSERISRREPTGRGIADMTLREFGGDSTAESGFVFTIPEHMRWAEMGVMRGLPSSKVQRGRKPSFKKRYANPYNPFTGNTFRPSFSQELAHLNRRYGRFLQDFYGQEMMTSMFDALGGEIEELDMGF